MIRRLWVYKEINILTIDNNVDNPKREIGEVNKERDRESVKFFPHYVH